MSVKQRVTDEIKEISNKLNSISLYGDREQNGLVITYKLAQSGKTGEAIEYLGNCTDTFCFFLTDNSSNLLVQTKDRIVTKLGKNVIRLDGGSNDTSKYNENIFSVCPKDPTVLRGEVCMVISNKVNLERMAVFQYCLDQHNLKNPKNQVHYRIIADEVDKTMTLTHNILENSETVQTVIKETEKKWQKIEKTK